MEQTDLANEIRVLCRRMIATRDNREQQLLGAALRARLHEHARQAHDRASDAIAQILKIEEHAKKLG